MFAVVKMNAKTLNFDYPCLVQPLRSLSFYTKFTPFGTPYDQSTVLAGVNMPRWGYRWAISWWDIVSAIKFFTAFSCIQRDVNIPAAPPYYSWFPLPPKIVTCFTTVWQAVRKTFCSCEMFTHFTFFPGLWLDMFKDRFKVKCSVTTQSTFQNAHCFIAASQKIRMLILIKS